MFLHRSRQQAGKKGITLVNEIGSAMHSCRLYGTSRGLFLWRHSLSRQNTFIVAARMSLVLPSAFCAVVRWLEWRAAFLSTILWARRLVFVGWRCRLFGIEDGRVQLLHVVGLKPPGLRMILAQYIPPLAFASAARGCHTAGNLKGTTITSPASVFKH